MSKRRPNRSPLTQEEQLGGELRLLLSDLCSQLGFCLPPDAQEELIVNPPRDVDEFTDAVLQAEGMDPVYVAGETRKPVRRMVEVKVGHLL